ncbi:glycerophosphodiester phosphodiesterase [Azohydromonas caseinilytica]|uniref:Glycerophosphodiester phosphodiesterase n=1 Tax=Azohydromonas caseinilytica TaxID=2728836 RepID=A0A848F558_9BURK|nr:glycerophosphodiester phosphodiesterase family protein [Azohydromonas caseinilytica]NML13776.1 glycerophosphodiester phosphodiesterase [Azohydromonas caseinilytica]
MRKLISPSGAQTIDAGTPTCCIGHRGARAFAPENTLPAFRKAAAMGCGMVELDVHLSRDGVPVVHHDDRLARCTDWAEKFPGHGSDFLSDFTLEQLRQLDAGSWYVKELALPAAGRQPFLQSLSEPELRQHVSGAEIEEYSSGHVRIPTLREALELAYELDLLVNIEVKTVPRFYPGIAAKVAATVEDLGLRRSVLVSSFDHRQLLDIRNLLPDLCTGVLTSDRLARPGAYLALMDADAFNPGCYDDFDTLGFGSVRGELEPSGLREVRAQGKMTFVWTCNEIRKFKALAAERVTGIITDYPNRFFATLREGG